MLNEAELNTLYNKIEVFQNFEKIKTPKIESFNLKFIQKPNLVSKTMTGSNSMTNPGGTIMTNSATDEFIMSTSEMIYTFEGPLKPQKVSESSSVVNERNKLQAVIDQYIETNKKLAEDLSKMVDQNELLVAHQNILLNVFEDFKDRLDALELGESFESEGHKKLDREAYFVLQGCCDKILDSLYSKEAQFFKQSMK